MAVYVGLLSPGDKIMGLDLPSGGHLTRVPGENYIKYISQKRKLDLGNITDDKMNAEEKLDLPLKSFHFETPECISMKLLIN